MRHYKTMKQIKMMRYYEPGEKYARLVMTFPTYERDYWVVHCDDHDFLLHAGVDLNKGSHKQWWHVLRYDGLVDSWRLLRSASSLAQCEGYLTKWRRWWSPSEHIWYGIDGAHVGLEKP